MKVTVVDGGHVVASDFAVDVRDGLTAPRKRLSCRYLYDELGSALFEHICDTPEYYLTRAEQSILDAHADEIVRAGAPNAALVELGSGSARKTRVLIAAMIRRQGRLRYVPIDISRSMLEESSRALAADHPELEITAIAAEYRAGLRVLRRERTQAKLVLWLGSNVGNFARAGAARFLRGVRAALGPRDRFLLGADLRKSRAVLEAAYDDAAGVTARFNLNLLARINRELGGHFELDGFVHRARWNERLGCMHMHLRSERAQTVAIDQLGLRVPFRAGETIFTESSYKYSLDEIGRLARAGGFAVERRWLDDERRFAVTLLAPTSA